MQVWVGPFSSLPFPQSLYPHPISVFNPWYCSLDFIADGFCSSHPHEKLTFLSTSNGLFLLPGLCKFSLQLERGSLEVLKLGSTYKTVNRENCPFPHILATIVALLFSSTFIYPPPPYTQCVYVHVPPCTSGGQRIICWSWFSPPTMWTMGSTLGLATNILKLITTLPSLWVFNSHCD